MNETEGKRNQNCIPGGWLVKKFESRLTHKRSRLRRGESDSGDQLKRRRQIWTICDKQSMFCTAFCTTLCDRSVCASDHSERLSVVVLGGTQRLGGPRRVRSTAGRTRVMRQSCRRGHGWLSTCTRLDHPHVIHLQRASFVLLTDYAWN